MEVTFSSIDDCGGFVRVRESTHVGRARRLARGLAEKAELGAEIAERAALVATELATNLVAHAGGGELHVRAERDDLLVLSLDSGPGIGNPDRAFRDGYSTSGTSGTGLGAVQRLSTSLDFESDAERGSVFACRLRRESARDGKLQHAGLVVPHPGEPKSGDGFLVAQDGARTLAVLLDGLGHGTLARSETEHALHALRDAPAGAGASALLDRMHRAMSRGGGAAASLAIIEPRAKRLTFAGIGNVSARVITPDAAPTTLVPVGGILGRDPLRARETTHAYQPGAVLVLHSDGITARWQPGDYRWAYRRDPALLAGMLLRDFRRPRDDASVLIVRRPA